MARGPPQPSEENEMPVADFTPEHKKESAYNYPRLKLDRGESARIILIEQRPHFEFVHTMRAPQIGPDGKPVMVTNTRFGKEVVEPEYDFIGRHICLGNIDVVSDKGIDAANCPVCATSKESSAVKAPERRFAMHVIRYQLKPGTSSFEVASPLQVQCVAWDFGDKIFNKIVDFKTEFGDLRKHDLKLGPCENKQYQKFDIAIAGDAIWLKNKEWMEQVKETYESNKAEDLALLIARRLSRELVEEDLDKVLIRHAQAFKGGINQENTEKETAAAVDVDGLLGDGASEAAAEPTPEVAEPEASAEPTPTTNEGSGTADFDDLLSKL
jgi:hypothetical protein